MIRFSAAKILSFSTSKHKQPDARPVHTQRAQRYVAGSLASDWLPEEPEDFYLSLSTPRDRIEAYLERMSEKREQALTDTICLDAQETVNDKGDVELTLYVPDAAVARTIVDLKQMPGMDFHFFGKYFDFAIQEPGYSTNGKLRVYVKPKSQKT